MTLGELKKVLGGRAGRSAPEACVRRALLSASNSRKRRDIFQATVEAEFASTYMLTCDEVEEERRRGVGGGGGLQREEVTCQRRQTPLR